jgi:hypothetical protein
MIVIAISSVPSDFGQALRRLVDQVVATSLMGLWGSSPISMRG